MFSYIKGTLADKTREIAIIEAGGIGYKIFIPYSTYQALPQIGEEAKLNTYMAIRENDVSLFGFATDEELRLFELLISVSGIGPKVASGILSDISVAEFSIAVISNDVSRLTKISGVGKKTAERMIVELKDKMKKEDIETIDIPEIKAVDNDDTEEAIAALQVLGYPNKEAVSMVGRVYKEGLSVEEIIKLALKS